jgi:hypothetical protein
MSQFGSLPPGCVNALTPLPAWAALPAARNGNDALVHLIPGLCSLKWSSFRPPHAKALSFFHIAGSLRLQSLPKLKASKHMRPKSAIDTTSQYTLPSFPAQLVTDEAAYTSIRTQVPSLRMSSE